MSDLHYSLTTAFPLTTRSLMRAVGSALRCSGRCELHRPVFPNYLPLCLASLSTVSTVRWDRGESWRLEGRSFRFRLPGYPQCERRRTERRFVSSEEELSRPHRSRDWRCLPR